MRFLWELKNFISSLFSRRTIGARALILKDDKVLLVKHTYMSGWYTIGGGVEKGESSLQALKRELQEEVGVSLTEPPSLLGFYHNPRKKWDDYVAVYVCKKFIREKVTSPEILEAKWFSLTSLPPDTTPGTLRRIEEYLGSRPLSDRW